MKILKRVSVINWVENCMKINKNECKNWLVIFVKNLVFLIESMNSSVQLRIVLLKKKDLLNPLAYKGMKERK